MTIANEITKMKSHKIKDTLFKDFVLGAHILNDGIVEINYDERKVVVTYSLPLQYEKTLWDLTKKFYKPPYGHYHQIPHYKHIIVFLKHIATALYIDTAKQHEWSFSIKEKMIRKSKNDNLILGWTIRNPSSKKIDKDIYDLIDKHDTEIYRKIKRMQLLKKINETEDNKAKDAKRKGLEERIDALIKKRHESLSNIRQRYIKRMIKAGLIDDNNKKLLWPDRFVANLKKLAARIILKKPQVLIKCEVCQKEFERLTDKKKLTCSNACRQKLHRAKQPLQSHPAN